MERNLLAGKQWVGIDPGQKGGVAFINENGLYKVEPMSDITTLLLTFKEHKPNIKHVYLEKSQSMPGQGVRSVGSYMEHYGQIQGLLIALSIPHTLVPPREWQKIMFVGTKAKNGDVKRKPKDRALEAANRVFARSAKDWLKSIRSSKPHDGMIDAALIAEACRRTIG